MVYKWKTEACIKADPNAAGAQFEQLEKTVGLTAKTVLNANRETGTPLHDEFEWDNDIAAENFRESQAAKMIRSICVEVETKESENMPVRAFFKTQESKGYESFDVILKNEDKYSQLLNSAVKELNAFIRKYDILQELQPLKETADMIQTKLNERR